ncbi:MATE family efflux transporter [Pontivivens ytuae]|uniref:MATE family efflux transporter n=1 Tax=Pontivivens ytuae TaxID=2789856 RepID=A0A7S9LS15_9RHOB|nr:MATE family efflux transporter [Pontivivens ytuae]QPH54034.1 MATE family efflux transporter [Pontivivens ytuae]
MKEITNRRVLTIAGPIVLSNATVPLLGLVDTYAVGQLGEAEPIGAVALGAIILSGVYWIFGFLRMGTTGLVAQATGRGDVPERDAHLSRALMIALAGGLGLIALQWPIAQLALTIAPASADVEELTRAYLFTRIWGAPFAIAVYALTGWLIAQERTGGVLVVQMGMNLTNIVLSLWFVLGLDMGVTGVAVATVIGEVLGAALGLWFCREVFRAPHWRDRARLQNAAVLRDMLSVNSDIMIRSVLLQLCFISVTFSASGLSDVTLAANQILLQFFYLTAYALDGFAFAAEAIVGTAFGAGDRARLRRGARLTSLWGLGSVVVVAVIFAVFGSAMIGEMTTAVPVQEEARNYLGWMVLAPIVGLPAFMLDGIFIGATRTKDMRNMMILSSALYAVSLVVLLPLFGNHGLWAALMVFFISRGITLGLRYPALEAAAVRT